MKEPDPVQPPPTLDPPESAVVDGTDGRGWRAELFEAAFHDGIVERGNDRAERKEQSHDGVCKHPREVFEGGQIDEHNYERSKRTCEQKDADRPEVDPVRRGEAAGERLPSPKMVIPAIPFDRARNLEGRRAQQAHSFVN